MEHTIIPWPYRILLPKDNYEKHRVLLQSLGVNILQFNCICHINCITHAYIMNGVSSGYSLIQIDDINDWDISKDKCYFCNKI